MTAQAKNASANPKVGAEIAKTSGKPPYPYRTIVSLLLLGVNILVAAIYFQVINP